MTETKRKASEASVEDLDQSIQEMEAELANGHGRPLTWDEVTSTTAEALVRKEQRRGILPRLIHAARVRRLEVEKRSREEEAAKLRGKLEPTYAAFQEEEERLRKAKEARDAARGEWAMTLSAVGSADDRTRRTEQELQELQEAGR